jgi:hypothetical protein
MGGGMSDPRITAIRRAHEHGTPFIHRVGKVLVLVTALVPTPAIEVKEASSSGGAREFVRRAVAERGWKAAPTCD